MFFQQHDQRVVVGSTATLRYTHQDQDGEPTTATNGVTVSVWTAAGDLHTATSTASSTSVGVYTTSVEIGGSLELLTATWTHDSIGQDTLVDVVGSVYFTSAAFQGFGDGLDKYSSAQIIDARAEAEAEAESIMGRAMVPRFRRVRLRADHPTRLRLPDWDIRTIAAVTSVNPAGTETDYTATQVANLVPDEVGLLRRRDGTAWPQADMFISYTYGLDRPPPPVVEAAKIRTRYYLTHPKTGVPDRAMSYTAEAGGTFRLSLPGNRRTGDPHVDAIYGRWARDEPVVAV